MRVERFGTFPRRRAYRCMVTLAVLGRRLSGVGLRCRSNDPATRESAARVVKSTDGRTRRGFVESQTAEGAQLLMYGALVRGDLTDRSMVCHSAEKDVLRVTRGNSLKSVWVDLSPDYDDTRYHTHHRHSDRSVAESAGKASLSAAARLAQHLPRRDWND